MPAAVDRDVCSPPGDIALGALLPFLCCPCCHGPLGSTGDALDCRNCGRGFPVTDGVPQLLADASVLDAGPSSKVRVGESAWIALARRMTRVPSPTLENQALRASQPRFIASFPEPSRIANIGSAALRPRRDVLNIDLVPGDNVDIVGDATRLPLCDASLDGIISRRVLEHVRKPGMAVDEMFRVLKPGGRVWCEIPFLQGYHPTPTDFQRYTRDGLIDLFDRFELLECGVALGPSSTLSWVLREYLSILFAFNNPYLYKLGERVFSWLTLPVKYLDVITARSRFAPQIASSFYIVAQKPHS